MKNFIGDDLFMKGNESESLLVVMVTGKSTTLGL